MRKWSLHWVYMLQNYSPWCTVSFIAFLDPQGYVTDSKMWLLKCAPQTYHVCEQPGCAKITEGVQFPVLGECFHMKLSCHFNVDKFGHFNVDQFGPVFHFNVDQLAQSKRHSPILWRICASWRKSPFVKCKNWFHYMFLGCCQNVLRHECVPVASRICIIISMLVGGQGEGISGHVGVGERGGQGLEIKPEKLDLGA